VKSEKYIMNNNDKMIKIFLVQLFNPKCLTTVSTETAII
jgi:hypothetical protein